jgi:hypothetical protein
MFSVDDLLGVLQKVVQTSKPKLQENKKINV